MTRRHLSRRRVLKGSVALAVLSSGGMAALLGACGDDSGATATATAGGAPASATATGAPFAGVTGDWDTTGTPPYKRGLPDSVAKPNQDWRRYPWVYKYGPWRYNWDVPVTRGGHSVTGYYLFPPANYDLMKGSLYAQLTNNKLYNAGLREGSNLLTPAIERDLALSEEHTPDYTQWTFKLPANAKFHNKPPVNGRLMTADDVVFSYQRNADTHVSKSGLRLVDKIEAVDPTTVRFRLKGPSLQFPAVLATPFYQVFAKEHFEDKQGFVKMPIGTGPFILDFNEPQNRADYVRNPAYWQAMPIKPEKYGKDPLPFVDKYTEQYFGNVVAANEAFLNGQTDNWGESIPVVSVLRDFLARMPNVNVAANAYWASTPLDVLFQYKAPLFQDLRVRQALSMGLDRQQIWQEGLDRFGAIAASPVPFAFQGIEVPLALNVYSANVQYNPERAKQLLKEAGHEPPLKLTAYRATPTLAALEAGTDAIIQSWKKSGVADVTLVLRENLVFTQDRLNKTFPDLIFNISNATANTVDASLSPLFLSDSPSNAASMSDAKVDEMLNQLATATDVKAAEDTAKKLSDRFIDQALGIWAVWVGGIDVAQPWLRGAVLSGFAHIDFIGAGNVKYEWMDASAPGGRGGKPI